MNQTTRCAPPNSIVFLEDPAGGKSPKIDDRPVSIWATPSCIIVGTLCSMDGETELIVSDQPNDVPPTRPTFDSFLQTPSRVIEVSTSEREILLRCPVETHFTHVRVWTNHLSEPDRVLVVLG
ncbi:hypothetical protein ACTZWT_10265 [Rhodopseudomonas sp. NSM]|uniref:hypothetical protein n=1 Tax=Rhodopseudomonas sp. NSM TaxID=3457630 RepID=UPI004035358D